MQGRVNMKQLFKKSTTLSSNLLHKCLKNCSSTSILISNRSRYPVGMTHTWTWSSNSPWRQSSPQNRKTTTLVWNWSMSFLPWSRMKKHWMPSLNWSGCQSSKANSNNTVISASKTSKWVWVHISTCASSSKSRMILWSIWLVQPTWSIFSLPISWRNPVRLTSWTTDSSWLMLWAHLIPVRHYSRSTSTKYGITSRTIHILENRSLVIGCVMRARRNTRSIRVYLMNWDSTSLRKYSAITRKMTSSVSTSMIVKPFCASWWLSIVITSSFRKSGVAMSIWSTRNKYWE